MNVNCHTCRALQKEVKRPHRKTPVKLLYSEGWWQVIPFLFWQPWHETHFQLSFSVWDTSAEERWFLKVGQESWLQLENKVGWGLYFFFPLCSFSSIFTLRNSIWEDWCLAYRRNLSAEGWFFLLCLFCLKEKQPNQTNTQEKEGKKKKRKRESHSSLIRKMSWEV